MSNSHKRYMNDSLLKRDPVYIVTTPEAVLAAKINSQIKSYQLRKLSAQDEYADITKVKLHSPYNLDMLSVWNRRLDQLDDEIAFCEFQIDAYQNDNNKVKIIPDRLL